MSKRSAPKKKVLVIEGNHKAATTLVKALTAKDQEAKSVGDGETALQKALEYSPDLIITNIMLPKVSGWDVISILKETPETQNIPIVMLSGLSRDDDKQKAADLGVAEYLVVGEATTKDIARTVTGMLHNNDEVMGLAPGEYDKSAGEYSKGVIFSWLVAGVIYSIIVGKLISLSTFLLFMPGIFVISIATIPFFYLKVRKHKSINAMNENESVMLFATGKRPSAAKSVPTLLFFTVTSIVGFLLPIVAAITFVRIMNHL
jgi:CheY-like chemotaxis protein